MEDGAVSYYMLIYYLMTFASILMETAKNVFSNKFSKDTLKTNTDVYKFNAVMYAGALLIMLGIIAVRGFSVSWFTVGMAALFAAASGEMQASFLRALRHGPLSYTNFIQVSGLVIPALYGTFFLGQDITVVQILGLPLLIVALALVMNLKRGEKGTGRWLLDAFLSMFCCGMIGVLQAIFQNSEHKDEMNSFLAFTFVFIVITNLVPWLIGERKEPAGFSIRKKEVLYPLLSGLFMGIVNVVNLFLVGVMPTVIFFPLVNGGLLMATVLSAVVLFREKLFPKQWIGLAIGLTALCMLSL